MTNPDTFDSTSSGKAPEFLNKAQVAQLLGVSKRTVDSLLAANQLPAVRFSKRLIRFPRQAVIDAMNARAVGRRS